ncbi:MAG: acyltransferase family protein [Bacilli bacterium]|nr:acyltransferase family protein [Bacilli bacterium]
MKDVNKRNINIDFIRVVAVFFVISVHFFMNVNYYGEIFAGKRMFIFTCLRTLSMVCVPLFLLLTGYLMKDKTLSKKYYKGIINILEIFLLSSILCILFNMYHFDVEITLKSAVLSILDYTGGPYSWYIEMYIGLFLLIPFLNIIWKNLESKKQKKILIITLIILTVLPTLFNIYDWKTPGFFLNPTLSTTYQPLLPKWWINIYPITYYFIGSYINEYNVKIDKNKNLFLLFLFILIFSIFNFYRNYNHSFDYGIYTSWNSFENVIISVLVFIFLLNLKLTKLNLFFKKIIIKIAELSLGTYLLSYIADKLFYPILLENVESVKLTLNYFLPFVIFIFIYSNLLSYILFILIKIYKKIILIIYSMFKKIFKTFKIKSKYFLIKEKVR